jgi:hypothetical protein
VVVRLPESQGHQLPAADGETSQRKAAMAEETTADHRTNTIIALRELPKAITELTADHPLRAVGLPVPIVVLIHPDLLQPVEELLETQELTLTDPAATREVTKTSHEAVDLPDLHTIREDPLMDLRVLPEDTHSPETATVAAIPEILRGLTVVVEATIADLPQVHDRVDPGQAIALEEADHLIQVGAGHLLVAVDHQEVHRAHHPAVAVVDHPEDEEAAKTFKTQQNENSI